MMTQPIRTFRDLTSEASPAEGIDKPKDILTFDQRRLVELRARYARAEMLTNALGDVILWLRRQYRRLGAAVRADFQVRAAEAQLMRMTDRELADLGLARGDIPFAVREAVHGIAPHFAGEAMPAAAANQNLRHAA